MIPQLETWESDGGVVTDKLALPMTGFAYGFLHEGHEARVRMGPLRCWGVASVGGGGSEADSCVARK